MYTHSFFIDAHAYDSGMRKWNIEAKLIFAAAAAIAVVVLNRPCASAYTFLFMGTLNIAVSRIPIRKYIRALSIPAVFIAAAGIAACINFSTAPKGLFCADLGFVCVYVTKDGIYEAFCGALRAFSAVSAMYLFTLSTPAGEFAAALQTLHLPAAAADLMHLIYRYIFIIIDIWRGMRAAQESRLGYSDFKTSMKSFGMMLGSLFIASMKRSGACFDAMEARSCGGCRFYVEKRRCTGVQAAAMAAYFAGMAALAGI